MAVSVSPDDSLDFLPLFPDESEDVIYARMEAWANEGLDPAVDTDLWVDTREGAHFFACTRPMARELARLYDRMGTEVPMSAIAVWSWGTYLDDLAATFRVERLPATQAGGIVTFTGPEGTPIGAGSTVSVEPTQEDGPAPAFAVTEDGVIGASGELELPVTAVEAGSEGNVVAGAITAPVTPLPGVTITNAAPMTGGSDAETDEALVERLLEQFEGRGSGRTRDYRVWSREQPGVGHVTVIPAWDGPGTVLVIVTDATGNPVSAETVTELQAKLDPVPGKGEGDAPVGAVVTVQTAALLNVAVVGTLDFETGYSLTGSGGTIALEAQIEAAVKEYVEAVQPGEEVVLSQVTARIALVPGVHDAGKLKLNGVAANLAVPSAPAKVPVLASLTLTEGTP